jgi:hypothetical protein
MSLKYEPAPELPHILRFAIMQKANVDEAPVCTILHHNII